MNGVVQQSSLGNLESGRLEAGMASRWDAFVLGSAQASFFHRAGWKSVIEASFGLDCHYLWAARDGRLCGVLPLVHLKSRLFRNALVSAPFCVYGGPLADDDEALAALEGAALELAKTLGVDHLEYRLRAPSRGGERPTNAALYATFRKTIAAEPEANLQAIPRKQRAMVRKGMKAGLTADWAAGIDRFFPVYAESLRNLGTPAFPKRYFRRLKEAFGEDCRILVINHGATPVAAVMSFYFRDEVLPYYGGGTAAARACAGHDFMYWEVLREAGAGGLRTFDFGRSKRGTGAFDFKRHWGFEPTPLYYEYVLLRGAEIPALNPTNPKYALAIKAWKRLPLPVANLLGPILSRHLG